MGSVGEKLRQARESQGRDLAQIAAETRIGSDFLAAIEADDLELLPGGFFTRSFIRQYARLLGVPDSEIERDLSRLLTEEEAPDIPGEEPRKAGSDLPPLARYANDQGKRGHRTLATAVILLAVVAACTAGLAFWLTEPEAPPAAEPAVAEESIPAPVAPADVVTAEREAASDAEPAAAESPVAATSTSAEGPLWLQIVANEETWVDITSGEQRLFRGILLPNERKNISGLEQARLVVGNAAGLEIIFNGKPVGPIGGRGQVRVVVLTPEGARISELGGAFRSQPPEGETTEPDGE